MRCTREYRSAAYQPIMYNFSRRFTFIAILRSWLPLNGSQMLQRGTRRHILVRHHGE
jgi:hypothetical protein